MNWSEQQYIPYHTTDLTGHKVLVLAPHPDDETLGCGGAILLHTRHNDPVRVVFLTDGAEGDFTGAYERDTYVPLRETEARQAATVLGISDLECWRVADRTLKPETGHVERLVALIEVYQPTLIYAPSPLEYHPDHRATAQLLWATVQRISTKIKVAFYEIYTPLRLNTLVDISAVVDQKRQACAAYQSQLEHHPYTDIALSLNRYRALTLPPECTYAEGFVVMEAEQMVDKQIDSFSLHQIRPLPADSDTVQPLVSIIVRTRNRPALLKQALESLTMQTYPNLEVIVINDAGDDVQDVCSDFEQFLHVHYKQHERQQGRAAAANTGLRHAQGKYINFLDDDDVLYPNHVAKLVGFLEKTGERVAYSDCEMGRYTWQGKAFVPVQEKFLYKGYNYDRNRLYASNYIPIMTACFARSLADDVGLMDETFDVFEDWDYLIRMAEKSMFHRLPGITAEYRILAEHGYDYVPWKLKIYQKHAGRCTLENTIYYLDTAEAITERLQSEISQLHQRVQHKNHELENVRVELNRLYTEEERLHRNIDQLQIELKRVYHEEQRLHQELRKLQDRFLPRLIRSIRRRMKHL